MFDNFCTKDQLKWIVTFINKQPYALKVFLKYFLVPCILSLCQSIGITLIMKNNATIGGNNVIQLILKNKLKVPFISTLLLTDGLIILLCFILEFFQPEVIKLTPEKIYLKYLNSIITFLMIIFLIYKLSSKMPIPPSKNNKSKKTNKPYKAKIKKVKKT